MKPLPFDPRYWQRASALIDELLALSPELQRARLLEIRAEEDAALVDDLERFLALHEQADRAAFMSGTSLPADLPPLQTAGDTIGAWTLVTLLGEGGMGVVWQAKRSDGRFQADAAIKLLKFGLFSPTALKRFQREGTLLARLRHPGIAQLLDAGVSQRGQPYLVLELVRGAAIDTWCRHRSIALPDRIHLFLQAVDAVAAAHRQLIVHRDLKPSNMLVTDDGHVKLLDFGIARIVIDDEGDDDRLTHEGALPYTPRYAAPEQTLGLEISTATDVYSLGVMLYELLTDQHPYCLSQEATPAEYKRAAGAGRIPPPSSRVAQKTARMLRGDIDTILGKALATEVAERYQSVAEFGEDLRRFLRFEPVAASRPSGIYRLRKLLRRHPFEAAAVVATSCALLIGASVAIWQGNEAQLAREQALRDLALSEATNEFMSFLLSESGGSAFTTSDLLDRAEGFLTKDTLSGHAVRARLLELLGDRWAQIGSTDRSLAALSAAAQEAHSDGDRALVARIDCTRAVVLAEGNPPEASMAILTQSLATLRGVTQGAESATGSCLLALSQVESMMMNRPADGAQHAREALEVFGRLPQADANRLDALSALADAEARLGNTASAVARYKEISSELMTRGRGRSSTTVAILGELANNQVRAGQVTDSLATLESALAIQRGMTNTESAPWQKLSYAATLALAGRGSEAKAQLVAVGHEDLGSNLRLRQEAVNVGTLVYCLAGADGQRCADYLDRYRPDNGAKDGISLRRPRWCLAAAHHAAAQGKPQAAKPLIDEALVGYKAEQTTSPILIRALLLRFNLLIDAGDIAAASADATRMRQLAQAQSAGFKASLWLGLASFAEGKLLMSRNYANRDERMTAREAARNALSTAQEHILASSGDKVPVLTEIRWRLNDLKSTAE